MPDPSGSAASTGGSRSASSRCSRRCCSLQGAAVPLADRPLRAVDREPHAAAARRSGRARAVRRARPRIPSLDLAELRQRADTATSTQAFVVVMRDGRRASNRPGVLPPGFGERLRRPPPCRRRIRARRAFGDRDGSANGSDRSSRGGRARRSPARARRRRRPTFGRRRGGGRGGPGGPRTSRPIVVSSTQVGPRRGADGPPPIEVAAARARADADLVRPRRCSAVGVDDGRAR